MKTGQIVGRIWPFVRLKIHASGKQMTTKVYRPGIGDRLVRNAIRRQLPKKRRLQFDQEVSDLMELEDRHLTDPATASHIYFAACMLSAIKCLRSNGLSELSARQELAKIASNIGRRSKAVFMWLAFAFSRDRLASVKRYSATLPNSYGPSFEIRERSLDEDGGFASDVHICGYRTFLARHGAQSILPAFCAWDRVWIDELPKDIDFARPTTIANGGKTCRFEFRRKRPDGE